MRGEGQIYGRALTPKIRALHQRQRELVAAHKHPGRAVVDEAKQVVERAFQLLVSVERRKFNDTLVALQHAGPTHSYAETLPSVEVAELANATAAACARDLGVDTPTVRFFALARPGDKVQFTAPARAGCYEHGTDEIWINAALAPRMVVEVVSHECGHFANLDEVDAQIYQERWRIG